MPDAETSPDALLLITPGCPHCATVLAALEPLIKEGTIGRLEVVNVAAHPETAADLGVRTAPWLHLGPFELDGARGEEELRQWAQRAGSGEGMAAYFREHLGSGRSAKVLELVRAHPDYLEPLVGLLAELDEETHIRLGVGAVLEDLRDTEAAPAAVAALAELTKADHPRTRSDACHFLGVLGHPDARPHLEACRGDSDPEVRETADEALTELTDGGSGG